MALEVKNLTGGYFGNPVLKDINFKVDDGQIVGLIGLNGAGKSTTIKEIIGLLTPFSGEISIDEVTIKSDKTAFRKKIGFIPETPNLYEELTLQEHIELTAMAYEIDKTVALERAKPMLETFRLSEKLDWFPSNFSKGMKQKVMIICAFLIRPSLYIIDEPFMGLDPLAVSDLTKLMITMKNQGASILMSTHILSTAEKFCDKFIVLNAGKVVADGNMDSLRLKFNLSDASLDDIYLHLNKGESLR